MPMGLKLGRASASPMVKKTMPVTRPAEATYSRKEYLRPSSSVPTCSVREAEALGRGEGRGWEGRVARMGRAATQTPTRPPG